MKDKKGTKGSSECESKKEMIIKFYFSVTLERFSRHISNDYLHMLEVNCQNFHLTLIDSGLIRNHLMRKVKKKVGFSRKEVMWISSIFIVFACGQCLMCITRTTRTRNIKTPWKIKRKIWEWKTKNFGTPSFLPVFLWSFFSAVFIFFLEWFWPATFYLRHFESVENEEQFQICLSISAGTPLVECLFFWRWLYLVEVVVTETDFRWLKVIFVALIAVNFPYALHNPKAKAYNNF